MIGNEHSKSVLDTFFNEMNTQGKVLFPFLIVEGDEGVGVWEYLREKVYGVVGMFQQDVLMLPDMSSDIDAKRHSIKVSVKSQEQIINSEEFGNVANFGAREIVSWLALSPTDRFRIVLIQGIERMTLSAANALLKSFEEPQPGCMIIGTTSHVGGLLDTIISRAMVVQTSLPNIDTFIETAYPTYKDKDFLARGISLVGRNKEEIDEIIEEETLLTAFSGLEESVLGTGPAYKIAPILKELTARRTHPQLLEAIIHRAEQTGAVDKLGDLLEAKKMMSANVKEENVWFGLGMK